MESKSCTKHVKVHGNCHVPKYMERYMEISMYLAIYKLQGTWKFPCTLQLNIWQGTWKFPCTLQLKIWQVTWIFSMYFYNGIARKYTDISIYQCTLAAKRHMKISVHLHCCIKAHGRHLMNTYHSELSTLFIIA